MSNLLDGARVRSARNTDNGEPKQNKFSICKQENMIFSVFFKYNSYNN